MLISRGGRTITTLLATVSLIAAGSAWATAQQDDGSGAQLREAVTGATPTIAVGEVQPAISRNFALFRERPASGMPDDAAAQVGSPERFGRNPALARAIKTVTGTGWVIPGDGYICIAVPDPIDGYGTSCLPTDSAIEQGLILSMGGNMPNREVAETLLVPDGARAVKNAGTSGEETVRTEVGVASAYVADAGALRATK